MKLKDLKVDNIVQLRNGEKYKVVYASRFILLTEVNGKDYIEITSSNGDKEYNENLTNNYDNNLDIVKVYNRHNVLIWSGNKQESVKEKKSIITQDLIDKIQPVMDAINEMIPDTDNEELVRERNKCRSLFEELKSRVDKKSNNEDEKIKNIKRKAKEYMINIENIKIEDDEFFQTVTVDGRGKLTPTQNEILQKIIDEELNK